MPRFIDIFSALSGLIPQVLPANKEIDVEASRGGKTVYREKTPPTLENKLFWSAMALLLYLVASQVPLYGMVVSSQSDGYYIMRMMMASNRATLMELGVSPIITSGMIVSLCLGARIFTVNLKDEKDQNLVNVAQTTLGILISLGSALTFVLGGQYGPVAVLGSLRCFLLVAQLVFAGIVVLLLDDLLGKGYGLGSGLNLFIVTNVCEGIVWACLSPLTITAGSASSTQFEGAFTHFFYVLMKDFSTKGLWDAVTRSEHTNLLNVLATITVFAGVVFVQGWTNESVLFAPEKYKELNRAIESQPKRPGVPPEAPYPRPIPIKLFYTSNMPIMLLSALQSSLYFFSQILFKRYPTNILVKLLGVWEETRGGRLGSRPVWGLAFLLNPPRDLTTALLEPFHTVFYIAFMVTACALLAGAWCEIMAGQSPGAQATMYKEAFGNMQPRAQATLFFEEVNGVKSKPTKDAGVLKRKIKTAAMLGGMALALLSVSADLLGAIGSGGGVLMAVTIICDMFTRARRDNPDDFLAMQQQMAQVAQTMEQNNLKTE